MSATSTTSRPASSAAVRPAVARRAAVEPATVGTTPDREELRRRGRLVLAERVVEKVAGQAAAEVAVTSGRSGGVLGLGGSPDRDARPQVEVELSGVSADLSIKVGIAYPGSIRAATQQVREHVTRRVEELTGVDVRRVDIDVTFLTLDLDGRRKEGLR